MFFGLLGGIGSRFILLALGAILITTVVGGFWMYQKSIISSLQQEVAQLKNENERLKIDLDRKTITIKTLEEIISQKEKDMQTLLQELEKNRKIIDENQKRLKETLEKLQDYERRDRFEKLLKSKKRELILKYLNKNVQCWIENFNRTDGECVKGKWVKKPNSP